MQYKYSEFIDDIDQCPPSHYKAGEMIAYRWVHANLDHPNNFLPLAKIKPQIVNDPATDLKTICRSYGLSLYKNLVKARKKYQDVLKQNPEIGLQVGEYIAEVSLTQADGVVSKPSRRDGHMTFHESVSVNLKSKLKIVGKANEL